MLNNKILKKEIYMAEEDFLLLLGDSNRLLRRVEEDSIDMIFADPPYFLSGGGITCSSGKMVSVNKGKWDTVVPFKKMHQFNKRWLKNCNRVLSKNGTIWISG
ncbi:MAG: site-specific DNA-methyltransferase, partial [Firmicutes bacterium HGW-Firmicutes-13]